MRGAKTVARLKHKNIGHNLLATSLFRQLGKTHAFFMLFHQNNAGFLVVGSSA